VKISIGHYVLEGTPEELIEYERLSEEAERKAKTTTTNCVINIPASFTAKGVADAIRDGLGKLNKLHETNVKAAKRDLQ